MILICIFKNMRTKQKSIDAKKFFGRIFKIKRVFIIKEEKKKEK
jgi:hypothetical protein